MEDILKRTIELLEGNTVAVWAGVVAQEGSTPRKTAARMLISADGDTLGSVGGGRLEAEVMEAARALADSRGSRLMDISLSGREVAETDMICGGHARIYVETLLPENLGFLRELQERIAARKRVALLTWIDEKKAFKDSHFILDPDDMENGLDRLPPSIREEVEHALGKGEASGVIPCPGEEGLLYLEPLKAAPLLHIFGGGHISVDLAWFAHRVGFQVVVVDDREEFANRERFPMAVAVKARPYGEVLATTGFGEDDYVVIVTRGHLYDLDVLRGVVRENTRYTGMIGSRRKRAMIYEQLLKEGVPQERLDRVHAPIGLDIGAETPAEIAASTVAELIGVLREGRRKKRQVW